MELYNSFESSNHLQPEFDKKQFEALHSWDFGYALLEPIDISANSDDEIELSRRLSPGQKALYFFWYLDAQVTNGGFIQFYWNGYGKYFSAIIEGLKLINDNTMLDLVNSSGYEYLDNKDYFKRQKQNDDWEPLYNDLKKFDELDDKYLECHHHTMELLEKYARDNPSDFVKLL